MWRISVIFGIVTVLYGVIILRLFYWQIIAGESLRAKAQTQLSSVANVASTRGEILSADGSPLVVNQQAYTVYAEPQHIENTERFAALVAPVLGETKEAVRELIEVPGRKWASLAKQIDSTKKQELERLALSGIGFETTSMRFYPEASMAAHVLGFVGLDAQGKQKGYFGLEGYYDRELKGKEGSIWGEKDAKGAPLLVSDRMQINPENGRTLVLWLDRSIQFIVEKRLKEGMKKYGAVSGSIIVMDPKSGGILAMASYPNYDPSHYMQFDDSFYKNPAVSDGYEPGSTFKPLIMAAGINENLLNATTEFNETGPIQIGEYSVKTWNEEYHGPITMTQVLQYSSNVGMVFVSRQLGEDKIVKYIKEFGMGEKTMVDLEEEDVTSLRDERQWAEIDYATASFGQGIAVTPLQVTRAVAALANEGWLMEPQIVKEFRDQDGKVVKQKERRVRQVISAKAARQITDMLVASAKYGEAKWAAPKGYKIAGKTGTAQIPVEGHYDEEKTIASFVGYAPADDPKFVMLVSLREPKTSPWGSETAAPLFFVIAKDLFSYLGISPTQ